MLQALQHKLPEIEFVVYPSGTPLSYVANGTADMDPYSYFMSSNRYAQVDFSHPINYYPTRIFTARKVEFKGETLTHAFDGWGNTLIILVIISLVIARWLHYYNHDTKAKGKNMRTC
jgi:hypothetical protein